MTSLIKHTAKEFYVKQSGITSLLNEFRCTKSKIMHNVTLRGGIASGIFKDKGILYNMQKCVQICCNAKKCHVAFMISGHCFSVTCKNQSLCEVVSARRTKYNSYIAYIYTRSKVDYKLKYNKTTTKGKYKQKKSKNLQEDKKQPKCSKRISKKQTLLARKQLSCMNVEKLKRMHAKETILLRKLAQLKLQMELIKNQRNNDNIRLL